MFFEHLLEQELHARCWCDVSYLKPIQDAFSFQILASVTETWSETTIQTFIKKIYLATKQYISNCSRRSLMNQNNKYGGVFSLDAEFETACFKMSQCSYFTFPNFSCKNLKINHKHHRAFLLEEPPGDRMWMLWREVICCDTLSQSVDELWGSRQQRSKGPSVLLWLRWLLANALCSPLYHPSKSQAQ